MDVGCAKGTWILQNAEANPDTNYLGLEIRRPVVEYCIERAKRWELTNAHFFATNANIDLPIIMTDLLERGVCIDMVTIHHPDPHFKKRHKKRRVVTDELVEEIANIVPLGCRSFFSLILRTCAITWPIPFSETRSTSLHMATTRAVWVTTRLHTAS